MLLVGEEAAGVQALRLLTAAAEVTLVAVATGTGAERSPHRRPVVAIAARDHGVDVIPAEDVRENGFASWLLRHEIDLLLNIHSLFVLPASVVAGPSIGSFNLHPGPLPGYAGLNCPSWAVYHGERTYGVTLHWMDAGVDTGRVAYTAAFPVSGTDTGLGVAASCVRAGVPLVGRLISDAARDPSSIPAHEQARDGRRYFGRGVPHNGRLSWAVPAAEIERLVRAADYAPFPSPWGYPTARIGDEDIGIVKVTLTGETAAASPGTVRGGPAGRHVATADEWLLIGKARRGGRTRDAVEVLPSTGRLGSGRIASRELP